MTLPAGIEPAGSEGRGPREGTAARRGSGASGNRPLVPGLRTLTCMVWFVKIRRAVHFCVHFPVGYTSLKSSRKNSVCGRKLEVPEKKEGGSSCPSSAYREGSSIWGGAGGLRRGHLGYRSPGPLTPHLGPQTGRGSLSPWGSSAEPAGMGESLHPGRMISWFGKLPLDAPEAQPRDWGLGPHLPGGPQVDVLGVQGQGWARPPWDRPLSPPSTPDTPARWLCTDPSVPLIPRRRGPGRGRGQGWGWAGDIMDRALPVPSRPRKPQHPAPGTGLWSWLWPAAPRVRRGGPGPTSPGGLSPGPPSLQGLLGSPRQCENQRGQLPPPPPPPPP